MARVRSAERARSKAAAIEDISRSLEQFQEILAQMEDFGREGFPYRDAARARAELRLRECIRRAFGDKSPESQQYRGYKLLVGNPQETKQSRAFIKTLVATLEDKKLELQGLKPPPVETPPPAPTPPPPTATPRPPQMTLVPPTTPTAQITLTPAVPVAPPPMTVSVALTTNLDMAGSSTATSSKQFSPAGVQPARPSPAPPPPVSSEPLITKPVVEAPPAPPPPPTPPAPPPAPVMATPAQAPPAADPPRSMETPAPPKAESPAAPTPPPPSPPVEAPKPADVSAFGQDSQDFIKLLCTRFHAVARQLRLRKEYRATLEVEDEFDMQDLIHAMLRLQFDDVELDEWTPNYTEGAPRTTFLLNHGRLAIVVKKTRAGLNKKELGDQVKIDTARYSTRNRCATLLCLIYDPEGRIGNPRGLESDLTSISDQFTVEVLVTPK